MIALTTPSLLSSALLLLKLASGAAATPDAATTSIISYSFCFYNVVDTDENKVLCTLACDALAKDLAAAALLATDSTEQCQAYSDLFSTLKDCLNCRETYGDEVTTYTKDTLYALYEPCGFDRLVLCSPIVAPGFTASAPSSTYLSGYSSEVSTAVASVNTTTTAASSSTLAQETSSASSNVSASSSVAQVNEAGSVGSPANVLMAAAIGLSGVLFL